MNPIISIINYQLYWLAQSSSNTIQDNSNNDMISTITLGKVIQGIVVLVSSYLILKLVDKLTIWLSERIAKQWRLSVKQISPFLRMFVLTTTTIILMNLFFNLSRENIIAVTGTVAVALGFAFKDYASSIIAGVVGLFESSYDVGDRVKIGEHYGEVMSYGLRAIKLQTPDDNIVTIPHNKIWTEAVSNSNAGALEAQVVTEFYFAHETDVNLVKKILYRVAHTSKYTALKLPILVIIEEKPWGTLFKLKCYPLDARDEFIYKTDLTIRAKQAFAQHKLTYPRIFRTEDNE